MKVANDSEKDLQTMMAQMQSITGAKHKIRDLLSQIQSEISSNESLPAATPCQTALCKSLSSRLNEISTATTNLQKSVRILVPAKPTFADLRTLQGQLQSNLDSLGDLTQSQQTKLQMLMDQRSKLVETMSNLMKTMSDTNSAIIQNIK
jgi:chromosome segregation ATPase